MLTWVRKLLAFSHSANVVQQRASEAAGLLQQIEVVSIRRIMVHNYIEHVSALLASPGAVPSVLVRCFGAQVGLR